MRLTELELIRSVNTALNDPVKATSDGVIMSVMTLAYFPSDESSWYTEYEPPFQAPLRSLQWLDVYGYVETNPIHTAGLLQIIGLRGGIENLKCAGLAPILSL